MALKLVAFHVAELVPVLPDVVPLTGTETTPASWRAGDCQFELSAPGAWANVSKTGVAGKVGGGGVAEWQVAVPVSVNVPLAVMKCQP